jgi:putative ABC transport system permease protein
MAALNAEAAAFGARSRRLGGRNLLVVTQFAMSTLLLVGALLLLRSFQRQQAIDPGFSLRDGAVVEVAPGLAPHTTGDDRRVLAERILVTARTLPGVRTATLAEYLPLGLATRRQKTEIEGTALAGSEAPEIDTAAVSDGYFETLGIGLLRGRGCAPADRMDQPPVVVVNETMARRFWPGRDALGQRLRRWGNAPWETVAGVAADSKYQTLGEPPRPFVYRCLFQQDPTEFALLVVGRSNDPRLLESVRRTLEQLDRDLPILNAVTLREHLSVSLFPTRLAGFLLFVFGVLGLVLAAAGLYGLVAHAVARRTRELGIRIALGAHRGTVARLILAQGMSLVAAGVGLGLALSWLTMRLLAGLLAGVSSRDPLSYLGVTVLLLAAGGLANILPVRRATRVDPVIALRAP